MFVLIYAGGIMATAGILFAFVRMILSDNKSRQHWDDAWPETARIIAERRAAGQYDVKKSEKDDD